MTNTTSLCGRVPEFERNLVAQRHPFDQILVFGQPRGAAPRFGKENPILKAMEIVADRHGLA